MCDVLRPTSPLDGFAEALALAGWASQRNSQALNWPPDSWLCQDSAPAALLGAVSSTGLMVLLGPRWGLALLAAAWVAHASAGDFTKATFQPGTLPLDTEGRQASQEAPAACMFKLLLGQTGWPVCAGARARRGHALCQ